MNICTIIAKNYLAHARVLAESFTEHHPDGRCFVLVIDATDGYIDDARESFTLLRPADLDLDAFEEMRGAYDVLELSTAVKPWLLGYMLRHHDDGSGVAYFDPDIRVVSRMVELEEELREHAVVLTPHVTRGMPRDGLKPGETDILVAGVYNLGFIGLSNRDDAHLLLDWWAERLRTDCHVAPERGLFVDQRWVDFVPGLVADLGIFRHPAYNVAYWNLPERDVAYADGTYVVNGQSLRFFHFSGYDPDRPDTLSKHQTRVRIGEHGAVQRICDQYADALRSAGYDDVRSWPYEHDVLPSGARLTKLMRGLYREGLERGECPETLFTPAGERDFMAYLAEPAEEAPGVSRVLWALWASRVDLQRAYPALDGIDREGYLGWCATYAAAQANLPAELIPSAVPAIATARPTLEPAPFLPAPPLFGVNLAGYLRAELGIGEVARQMIGALDAVDVPVLPVGLFAPNSRQGHGYVAASHERNPFPVNLICVNADGLPGFAKETGEGFFEDRYSIGVWWWETSELPARFSDAFQYVDEVWVGSRFVADALAERSPVPVVHVPIPMHFAPAAPLRAGEHRWPDAFTFLFSYDYNSVFRRKNPLAVIEAYTNAFGPEDGAALVLKSINHTFDAGGHRRVREAIAGREDIVVIDGYLDAREKDRLMASGDCYVSLHRSEGLGLTMAEAMAYGTPVIATNYSGNTDFMTNDNSYPVGYELVPIGPDADPYPADGVWAEPDVAQASRLMREVFEHPDEARRRGARAAEDMRATYAPAAAGAVMKQRLERVAARLPQSQPPDVYARADEDRMEHVRTLVARGPAPQRRSRFGKPGGALRKLLLRGLRPYTAYQQQVNEALQGELDERARIGAVARSEQADRLLETFAAAMGELRRQRADVAQLQGAVEVQIRAEQLERERRLIGSDRLLAETRALPYMAAEVFSIQDAGPAGRVLGYSARDEVSDADAYRAFEDLFRGSEAFIAARQRRYLDLVRGCAPAVDVGCGRGEFLDLLAEEGIEATGIDADPGMVARCREKGHDRTIEGDGVAYLDTLDDASLGLVFSAQVVEHLPPTVLENFLGVAARKLRPGGLFIAETVNPHSVPAMKTFWMDITHQHPLFPEALLGLCRIAGFSSAYVFHPNGVGDVEVDRYVSGEYAIVARR